GIFSKNITFSYHLFFSLIGCIESFQLTRKSVIISDNSGALGPYYHIFGHFYFSVYEWKWETRK
ncbi:hypothetical protein UW648_09365, partial [Streptococcus agalactiae]